jgi:exopolysaccharide biosynthesis polyprenyl glycosylphosphotransferase
MTELTASPVDGMIGGPPRPPTSQVRAHAEIVDTSVTPENVAGDGRYAWAVHLLDAVGAALAATLVTAAGVASDPLTVAVLVASWVALLAASGGRAATHPLAGWTAGCRHVLRAGLLLGAACWVGGWLLGPIVAAGATVPLVASLVLAGLLGRVLAARLREPARLVVAGHPDDLDSVLPELVRSREHDVVACCVTEEPRSVARIPRAHVGIDDAATVAARQDADAVLLVPGPHLTAATLRHIQWQAERTRVHVYLGTGLHDVAPWRTTHARAGGLGVLHVRPSARRGPRRLLKGAVERTLALGALAALAPLFLLLWALIRLDSPGRAIFRQERVGLDGSRFSMLKFRTMRCTAEAERDALQSVNESGDVLFKIRADPRVTRIGTVLRRYSLDELPQLWNVVRGDMALVGPRPALPEEVARYGDDARRRLVVKPGLTGLWQVSGRSDLSWAETVRLDVDYVDNWSLARDAVLVCRTFEAVASHRGAY